MRDHWWWRPGWRVGRRFYTWHLTFDQASAQGSHALQEMVDDYQAQLAMPGLDLVPFEWLHLTMQGVGFTDEISRSDVQQIAAAAKMRCGEMASATLTLGPATVDPEGILLRVSPAESVRQVRAALRRAIADVWGTDAVPEPAEDFTPHVTIAYSNSEGPAAPFAEIVHEVGPRSATVTVGAAQLIVLGRDAHLYQWRTYATVPLGNPPMA
jgi:2'-5' RNA ligase